MSPYETPFYFILFGGAAIPMACLLLLGKRRLWYQCIMTILFLFMSFGGANYKQGLALVSYLLFQTALSFAYAHYRRNRNAGSVFAGAVILALTPLILTKLSSAFFESLSIVGFLGISYLTFKSVQVIIETRDGLIKDYNLWHYMQFLMFFTTLSAGPIDRYRHFEQGLTTPPTPDRYTEMLRNGIACIFTGFLYNYIIAHLLGNFLLPVVKDYVFSGGGVLGVLCYMYVYSLFLFFDFAGYSKFAIGTAYLMGYEIPPNFNMPFLSSNIKEFWNRWHMSLSFWFRDYVYMRIMMMLLQKKVFRSRVTASNVSYVVLFFLMGLWHGLTWYYIAYGLYHAGMICINDGWLRYKKKHKDGIPSNRFTKMLAVVITFNAVCGGFLIFSGFLDVLLKQG
jgi:membrane protein involved in D-alanine export